MIGKAKTGSGFGGLLAYLFVGSDGQQADRVEWSSVRNLFPDDQDLVPAILQATASRNVRVEKPVYHLSISLDPSESLDQDGFEKVVDRTLRDLGLGEHQSVIVAHNDTEHAHVHVVVNRVHPETLKAWDNGHDWARIEKSLRQQERELGFREVPGRHFALEGEERHQGARLTSGEIRQVERLGERPFGETVRELARESFRRAQSWEHLHDELAQVGLYLERRGRGLVVSNGDRRVKASYVDRDASRMRLEKRLGAFRDPTLAQVASASERWREVTGLREDAFELAREQVAAEEREKAAQDEGFRERRSREEIERLEGQGSMLDEEFARRLSKAFRQGEEAQRRVDDSIAREGPGSVARTLDRTPEAFGRLRGRGGLLTNAERWEARDSAGHAADVLRRRARVDKKLRDLRKPRDKPSTRPLERGLSSVGRHLAKAVDRRVRRLGWQVAARVIPVRELRILARVVQASTALATPYLKALVLATEVGTKVAKMAVEKALER